MAFGLKMAFGDHVHCIFAEPTDSPCMLLGVYSGLHDDICVQDIGLDNRTAADGLAVGRASGFVGRAMERLVDGYFTISDEHMFQLLGQVYHAENIALEPSAVAGMLGPLKVNQANAYLKRIGLNTRMMQNANHIVWATGGGMVPEQEMKAYRQKAALCFTPT